MKNFFTVMGRVISCGAFLLGSNVVVAQKLPDEQENSLRAPASVKIDGKTTEWNNTFQAYNKSNALSYTVANDDNNLYLVIQSANPSTITKIMRGGITFTVNNAAKKKEKDGVSVMFPVPGKNDMRSMMEGMRTMATRPGANMASTDPATMMKRMDSMAFEMNRQQIDKLKDIKISGIKEITDTLLSIYNEEGIKARALFDSKSAFNYELAIPLKYLGISVDNPKEFTYNIKLNGMQLNFGGMNMTMRSPGGGGGGALPPPVAVERVVVNGGPMGGGGAFDIQSLISPTDFWGKYILIKK